MKHEFAPHRLDVSAFAQSGGQLSGQEPLSRFARVTQECREPGEALNVAWSASGEIRSGQPGDGQVWLHVEAQAQVP